MDGELLYRSVQVENDQAVDTDNRTIELSFSSESPVERSFGNEVLDHSPGSVDLSRINSGAPLLLEHDRSQQIGVVERAWVDEESKKGRAVVKFSRSALGQEVLADIQDHVRSLVSVGYTVSNFSREVVEEGLDTFRATSWLPMEISVVSIPADMSVGVGRAYLEPSTTQQPTDSIMEEPTQEIREEKVVEQAAEPKPEVRIEVRPDKRSEDIANLGSRHNAKDEAIRFISEGKSLDDFKTFLMERNASQPLESLKGDDELGLSKNEQRQYSLVRAINSYAATGQIDGLELEAHKELERDFGGRPANGFYVPNDVFNRELTSTQSSDTGDKLVETVKPEMIGALVAEPIVQSLGARVISGLTGNVILPKASSTTATWTDEVDSGSALSEQTMTLGSVSLSPKRIASYSEYSRQLLQTASFSVEELLRTDLVRSLALGIDQAALQGTGSSNQPTGVLNASGINTQSGGQTWQNMLDAEADVMNDHALAGSLAYLTTPSVMATLKATDKGTDTGQFIWANNQINGVPAYATTQMGSTAQTLFGDFSQIIIGEFGRGLDVLVDPYSMSLTGLNRIHVARLADVAVRHDEAFCLISA